MTVDSVRWYLEACSNYTLGDATAKSPFIANDSFILKIPVSQNYSLINDVGLAYNTINENVMYSTPHSSDQGLPFLNLIFNEISVCCYC